MSLQTNSLRNPYLIPFKLNQDLQAFINCKTCLEVLTNFDFSFTTPFGIHLALFFRPVLWELDSCRRNIIEQYEISSRTNVFMQLHWRNKSSQTMVCVD